MRCTWTGADLVWSEVRWCGARRVVFDLMWYFVLVVVWCFLTCVWFLSDWSDVAWCHAMLCHVVSSRAPLSVLVWCDLMWCDVTWCALIYLCWTAHPGAGVERCLPGLPRCSHVRLRPPFLLTAREQQAGDTSLTLIYIFFNDLRLFPGQLTPEQCLDHSLGWSCHTSELTVAPSRRLNAILVLVLVLYSLCGVSACMLTDCDSHDVLTRTPFPWNITLGDKNG